MKDELTKLYQQMVTQGLGMFSIKPKLPTPDPEELKKLLAPGVPTARDSLFDLKTLSAKDIFNQPPPKTAAQLQQEAYQAMLQDRTRARSLRLDQVKGQMLTELAFLLEELKPTQLLLQSPHYSKLTELLEHIEHGPDPQAEASKRIQEISRHFKENFL